MYGKAITKSGLIHYEGNVVVVAEDTLANGYQRELGEMTLSNGNTLSVVRGKGNSNFSWVPLGDKSEQVSPE